MSPAAWWLLVALSFAKPPAGAFEADLREDDGPAFDGEGDDHGLDSGEPLAAEYTHLGPSRELVVLGFPVDLVYSSISKKPMLGVEVRLAASEGWAVGIEPIIVWYVGGDAFPTDGVGVGLVVSAQYYFDRSLAGGFVALQAGDIEAFIGGEYGRTVGGAAIFGYALSWDDGAQVSLGLGFGYWHRMGVVGGGMTIPELLALRLGVGWGWSTDPPEAEGAQGRARVREAGDEGSDR